MKYINYANLFLITICSLFLLAAFIFALQASSSPLMQPPIPEKISGPPYHAFKQKPHAYQEIKEPALTLKYSDQDLPLPDLRNLLIYYGSNKRPDADTKNNKLYFSLGNPKEIFALKAKTPYYLIRDKVTRKYQLSPNNQSTPLWINVSSLGTSAKVEVRMIGVRGSVITEPKEFADFVVAEKPIPPQISNTEIGKWKADGALLARQKAKWYGEDLFLKNHGGHEFQVDSKQQKIDFGEGEDHYSVFVKPNEFLIWKDNRWQRPEKGENTQDYPLLFVKKADAKLMNLELWDKEGKSKIPFNLIKFSDPVPKIELTQNFQFIGARTKIHFMFNVDGKREIVGPQDWFLLGPEGWQKLSKVRDIDAYVNGDLKGPLLVIDSIGTDQKERVLKGFLYNSSRSEAAAVEIPLKPLSKQAEPQQAPVSIPANEEAQ